MNEELEVSAEELEKIERDSANLEKDKLTWEDGEYHGVINQLIKDIQPYPLLTPEEEYSIAVKAKEGDIEAQNKLINSNYRLVLSIARRYAPKDHNQQILEDYFQEGCLGLQKAVTRYSPELGFKFSTYATWWIQQAITRYKANNDTIRIPVHLSEKARRYNVWYNRYVADNYFSPTIDECKDKVKELGISEDVWSSYLSVISPVSLNTIISPQGENEDTELGDFVKAPTNVADEAEKIVLAEVLETTLNTMLTEREIFVLKQRIYEEKTLEEVGRELNLTRERVRQIESKALRRLRFSRRSRHLRDLKEFVV